MRGYKIIMRFRYVNLLASLSLDKIKLNHTQDHLYASDKSI